MRTHRQPFPVAVVLAASLPSLVLAGGEEYCDQGLLELMDGARAYQLRDGNRCEGEYAQQVNSGLLEVKSFTASEIDYVIDRPGELFVAWDRPPEISRPVRLRGASLPHDLYYRMDTAVPVHDAEFEWSLDVLANLGIGPRDLGVSGWIETVSDTRIYLPVSVGQGHARPLGNELRLTVVSNYEISKLFVKIRRSSWPGSGEPMGEIIKQHEPDDFGFPAKRPFSISLERPREKGVFAVEVGFQYDDNTIPGGQLLGTDTVLFFSAGPSGLGTLQGG